MGLLTVDELTQSVLRVTMSRQSGQEGFRHHLARLADQATGAHRIACSISDGMVSTGNRPARIAARNDWWSFST